MSTLSSLISLPFIIATCLLSTVVTSKNHVEEFNDIASQTYLADTVIAGDALNKTKLSKLSYIATFRVTSILDGELPGFVYDNAKQYLISVKIFVPKARQNSLVDVKINLSYIVFLKSNLILTPELAYPVYVINSQPVPDSPAVRNQVNSVSCEGCGKKHTT